MIQSQFSTPTQTMLDQEKATSKWPDQADVLSSSGAFSATVQACLSDGLYQLKAGEEEIRASHTLSCIFSPAKEDQVLVVRDDSGHYLITAIIRRPSKEPLLIASDRALAFDVEHLVVNSKGKIALKSQDYQTTAHTHKQHAEQYELVSEEANVTVYKGNLVARQITNSVDLVTSTINNFFQKIGFSSKVVKKFESNQSAVRQDNIDASWKVHAGSANIQSRDNLSITSRQIFMN